MLKDLCYHNGNGPFANKLFKCPLPSTGYSLCNFSILQIALKVIILLHFPDTKIQMHWEQAMVRTQASVEASFQLNGKLSLQEFPYLLIKYTQPGLHIHRSIF